MKVLKQKYPGVTMAAKKRFVSPYKHRHVESEAKRGKVIKELVFGIQDGSLTTLGVVTGVTGAAAGNSLIILAGIVSLIAEAISMGAGEYLSSKSEIEVYKHEIKLEKLEMKEVPEIERWEVEKIYRAKGFKGALLKKVVDRITASKKLWLDTMLLEELGFPKKFDNPKKLGFIMLLTSLIGGAIPLIPYLFMAASSAVLFSVLMTAAALFAVGTAKTIMIKGNWIKGGIEMMLVGMLVAFTGYSIGSIVGVYV